MEPGWIKIYTTASPLQAELVKQVLTEFEIGAVILNRQDNSYKFGEIGVYIHESDEQQATDLIRESEL